LRYRCDAPRALEMIHREILQLLEQTRNLLSFHQQLGIDSYPQTPALMKLLQDHQKATPAPAPRRSALDTGLPAATPVAPPAVPPVNQPLRGRLTIAELRQEIAGCRQCPLAETRQAQTPAEGNGESGLLIIADAPLSGNGKEAAPGVREHAGGLSGKVRIFSGQADELLTRMLAAISLERESVYISPLLKCLPAHPPQPEELQQCLAMLRLEISAMAPRIICTMGPLAARTLLGSGEPLFKLRGRFHSFLNLPLMPTFHPAYLLRNPEMKKAAWQDLQAIQKGLAQRPA
jgi:uracil-DNA glycosylase